MPFNLIVFRSVAAGLFSLLMVFGAAAQDSDTVPAPAPAPASTPVPSAATQRLQAQIDRLKMQKEKEELEKAIRDAQQQPTATPLNGDVTGSDKLKMEGNLQTYKSVRQITNSIACEIKTRQLNTTTFILYKADIYGAWRNFRSSDEAIKIQLSEIINEYKLWLAEYRIAKLIEKKNLINRTENWSDKSVELEKISSDISIEQKNRVDAFKLLGMNVLPVPEGDAGADVEGSALVAASAALLGGKTVVSSLADVLNMFRTNVEFASSDVTLNEQALKSMLAESIRFATVGKDGACSFDKRQDVSIFDPEVFYPLQEMQPETKDDAANPAKPAKSKIPLTEEERCTPQERKTLSITCYINELSRLKRAAEILIADYDVQTADIAKFRTDIDKFEDILGATSEKLFAKQEESRGLAIQIAKAKPGDEKDALEKNRTNLETEIAILQKKFTRYENKRVAAQNELTNLETLLTRNQKLKISRLRQLNTDFDQFFAAAATRDETTQVSPLMLYNKAEILDSILKTKNALWLEIRAVQAGGSTRIQKNLFRYFYKPDISFSGASIIEYTVSDIDGNILLSNTKSAYIKNQKASKILPGPPQ